MAGTRAPLGAILAMQRLVGNRTTIGLLTCSPLRVPVTPSGGPGTARHAVVQREWVLDSEYEGEGVLYSQDVPFEERVWQVRIVDGEEEYRYSRKGETSDWGTAKSFVEQGMPPPLGAMFGEQRRRADQDANTLVKVAYKESPLPSGTPPDVLDLQANVSEALAEIEKRRKRDKALLDAIIDEEFTKVTAVSAAVVQAVRTGNQSRADELLLMEFFSLQDVTFMLGHQTFSNDQIEQLQSGLRYKRVFEHEQNLVTINRRALGELNQAIADLRAEAQKQGVELKVKELGILDIGEGARFAVVATAATVKYHLGTLATDDARFQRIRGREGEVPTVYQELGTGKQYVKDRYGRFVPRFVRRAIRYEDAINILADEPMATKKELDEEAGGKEAKDYGIEPGALTHRQKVMGQIRGYGRFLSTTSSERRATSTSRGTYLSPFGEVEIDLAQMPAEAFAEAHSERAMVDIFGLEDVGQLEFIPKHLKGEAAKTKAGRDAYRAREIVIGIPHPSAVRTEPSHTQAKGLVMIGLTSSATEEEIRTACGKYEKFISYVEVNTNYKRTIDGHEGRSAFVFFADDTSIGQVIKLLNRTAKGAAGFSPDDTPYFKEVPGGAELSAYRNPRQRMNVRKRLGGLQEKIEEVMALLVQARPLVKGRRQLMLDATDALFAEELAELKQRAEEDDEKTFQPALMETRQELKDQLTEFLEHFSRPERKRPEISALVTAAERL